MTVTITDEPVTAPKWQSIITYLGTTCCECGTFVCSGTQAEWSPGKGIRHLKCGANKPAAPPIHTDTTGVSAEEIVRALTMSKVNSHMASIVHHKGGAGTSTLEYWRVAQGPLWAWRVKVEMKGWQPHYVACGLGHDKDSAYKAADKIARRMAKERRQSA